jgi:hypothetical protein
VIVVEASRAGGRASDHVAASARQVVGEPRAAAPACDVNLAPGACTSRRSGSASACPTSTRACGVGCSEAQMPFDLNVNGKNRDLDG